MPGLKTDVINPDSINWHVRAYNFAVALVEGKLDNTYQVYHPGTTLMWLTGPVLYSVGSYFQAHGDTLYSKSTFIYYDWAAKISLILACSVLFFIALKLLAKTANPSTLILFSAMSIFEPFILGERRLFHLDTLMSCLLLVSFLFFFIYFYTERKLRYFIFGCMFFALAVLTKTTSLVFLPIIFMLATFARIKLTKKLLMFPATIATILLFIYVFFPAVWKDPIHNVPIYAQKMFVGINDIGYQGKKELGYSGKQPSVILKRTMKKQPWDYYLKVTMYRTSTGIWLIAGMAVLVIFSYGICRFVWLVQRRRSPMNPVTLLGFYAFIVAAAFYVALTVATKTSERYEVVAMPFLFLVIAATVNETKATWTAILIGAYLISLVPQYKEIYPYFFEYGNPLLGGVNGKNTTLKSPAFGVATYQVYKAIQADRQGNTGLYSIAGTKSLKAISAGAQATTAPNCTTLYYVAYAFDRKPKNYCVGKRFKLVSTIYVGNMAYWQVYKNLSVSKYVESSVQVNQQGDSSEN